MEYGFCSDGIHHQLRQRHLEYPVVFFTGFHYDSGRYDAMVRRLYDLKK